MDTKPAFCASCIDVRADLKPYLRRGRTVWLCPECIDPLAGLRQHDIRDSGGRYSCTVPRGRGK